MEQLIVQDGLHTVRERELNTHQPAMYMYVCTRATPSQTHIKTTARHLPSQTNIQPVTTCTCTCTYYCQTPLPSPHLQGSGVWSPPLLVPYDGLQQLVVEGEAEVQPQPGKATTGRLPFLGGGAHRAGTWYIHVHVINTACMDVHVHVHVHMCAHDTVWFSYMYLQLGTPPGTYR